MLLKGLFRGTVVACLLAGVVWVSSGFAVVSGANVAKSGGVCGKAGARVVSQSVSLVCKKMVSGKLVWRVVKASTTSTTTTTTVGPTTASAPKVAVVAPRVVSASSATGNAVITIADMSPDTGVYAVQWVPSGQDFNSYQMYRTTTKTMTVPYLSCTRTYTLRVFVMQENWQMSDGFVNQNVTPHSATFDLTMPACTAAARATAAATTTTVALTCATGGTCIVGDTGPGGGLVFYVHASGTFTCGATLASTCKYLEAAPNTWSGGSADPTKLWAISTYQSSDIATITNDSSAYNNALGIGLGYKNSLAIVNQGNDTTTAAGAARAYGGGSKSDWYLPTTAELNLLCQWARNVAQSVTTRCTGGTLNFGTGALGGFSRVWPYWSSSEVGTVGAWDQSFDNGIQNGSTKNLSFSVRPVRAFGPTG